MENRKIFTFKYGEEFRKQNSPNYKKIQYVIGGINNDCWECISHFGSNSYPKVHVKGKQWKISRWSYTNYYKKEIKEGMDILHSCDNPSCINPFHLREGTDADNAQDRVDRNRTSTLRGEDSLKSKLKEEQVNEIMNDSILSVKKLAKKYNVSISAIYQIKNNRTWNHLEKNIDKSVIRKRNIITEDIKSYILNNPQMTLKQLSEHTGISISTISKFEKNNNVSRR